MSTVESPAELCIEVQRYAPDATCPEQGYGVAFHWFTEATKDEPFAMTFDSVYTPPEMAMWFVPRVEGWARQSSDWAKERYARLNGWEPKPLSQLVPDFREYVIRHVAPLEWKAAMTAGDTEVLDRFTVWLPTVDEEDTMNLPTDEDGEIITSAEFGEHFVVRIEWNTNADGTPVEPFVDDHPETLHGPFDTEEEAMSWMEAFPEDTDIHDMSVITMNRVRPSVQEELDELEAKADAIATKQAIIIDVLAEHSQHLNEAKRRITELRGEDM